MLQKQQFLVADLLTRHRKTTPSDFALQEAVAWIYRAQNATPDRGASHSYLLGKGWAPSYPETTGYIIPTLLNWCKVAANVEAKNRALEMADWECEIQLEDGAVMGSVVTSAPPKPVVFNTGQVIFGWVAAYRETQGKHYLAAASRAASWLTDRLGSQETWHSHGSMGADKLHTYNIRAAWALLELDKTLGTAAYGEPVRRVANWTLRQEKSPGWFDNNCLTKNDEPLLHTIAYTARGLLETGLLLGENKCVDAAKRTADALIPMIQADGRMAGRYDRQWKAMAKWSCLTGMAQMSIVWQKLHAITNDQKYAKSASTVNRFLRARQRVRSANPGIRGGIPGSYPINGDYGKYRILNWATKFYIDALLFEQHPSLLALAQTLPG